MSSVYFHFFTDRLSFGDDWTEFLFLLYANHTLPTATFSITVLFTRGRGHHRFNFANQLQLRRMEGRGRGGWLEREREG